jgi:hypothetical protein
VVREVFSFHPRAGGGTHGEFVATGVVPALTEVLAERGEAMPASLFEAGPDLLADPAGSGPAPRLQRIRIGWPPVPGDPA